MLIFVKEGLREPHRIGPAGLDRYMFGSKLWDCVTGTQKFV